VIDIGFGYTNCGKIFICLVVIIDSTGVASMGRLCMVLSGYVEKNYSYTACPSIYFFMALKAFLYRSYS